MKALGMSETEKICVFDFCETLVDFQTANAFVDFVRKRSGTIRMRLCESIYGILRKTKALKLMEHLSGYRYSIGKRIKLYQLKGFRECDIEEMAKAFYVEMIHPHFIKESLSELERRRGDGFKVGLVSGGYGIYLKYFVKDFQLDFLLSSNIAFANHRCIGKIAGNDCMRDNKVVALKEYFDSNPLRSVAYSDSKADLPLLLWAREGVVLSRSRHQDWIDGYGFREIIWKS